MANRKIAQGGVGPKSATFDIFNLVAKEREAQSHAKLISFPSCHRWPICQKWQICISRILTYTIESSVCFYHPCPALRTVLSRFWMADLKSYRSPPNRDVDTHGNFLDVSIISIPKQSSSIVKKHLSGISVAFKRGVRATGMLWN